MTKDDPNAPCRVLIVEDEVMIAFMIEDAIGDLSYEIVGPTGRLDMALCLAKEEKLDAAVLDVSIRDQKVFPVAEWLVARGIPFILASGYGDWALPDNLRDRPRLTKPFTIRELKRQMKNLCEPTIAGHET